MIDPKTIYSTGKYNIATDRFEPPGVATIVSHRIVRAQTVEALEAAVAEALKRAEPRWPCFARMEADSP